MSENRSTDRPQLEQRRDVLQAARMELGVLKVSLNDIDNRIIMLPSAAGEFGRHFGLAHDRLASAYAWLTAMSADYTLEQIGIDELLTAPVSDSDGLDAVCRQASKEPAKDVQP
jgi:hypothetical protein